MNIKKLPDRVSAGPKDRDQRPHSTRCSRTQCGDRFDVLMVWSIDRLGAAFSTWPMPWLSWMPSWAIDRL